MAETKTGGTWSSPTGLATIGEVAMSYYDDSDGDTNDDADGDTGDLKLITVTMPLSESANSLTKKVYFRYYSGTYDSSSNPGVSHDIKMVLSPEGVRQSGLSSSGLETASTDSLKPYASGYYKYNTDHQVKEAWFSSGCNCSGASNGTFTYRYETNGSYTDNSGYDSTWATRVTVKSPDTYSGGSVYRWVT